jgi:hypothetical protein
VEIDPKDKCTHRYKHDYIDRYTDRQTDNMLVIVNFLKGLGRGVREKEYDRE